jgi:hypothetical protein
MSNVLRAVYALNNTAIKYKVKISVSKKETMAMERKMNVKTKLTINNHIIEDFIITWDI